MLSPGFQASIKALARTESGQSQVTAVIRATAKIEEIPLRITMNHTLHNRRNRSARLPVLSQVIASSLCLGLLGSIGMPAIAEPIAPPVVAQSQMAPATKPIADQLMGQWQAKDASGQRQLTFVFGPEGQLFIVLPSPEETAPAIQMAYKIDPASQPMHLDVKINGDETVLTVFEFTDKGQLRLQLEGTNPGQPRPTAFSEGATVFDKISDATTLPANAKVVDLENPGN